MISVRLMGGLGNQIFQLAATLLISKKCNDTVLFYDDSALGKYDEARNNELNVFFDFSNTDISLTKKKSFVHTLRLAKLLPYINYFVSDRNFFNVDKKNHFSFIYMDGYFQDCLLATDLIFLVNTLKPSLLPYEVSEKPLDCCVIHVRGGDFIKLGWDSVSSVRYYEQAIGHMINKNNVKTFDIITDDVDYAKELLSSINLPLSFINGSMQDDFHNIGSYSYRILSSSTFAFWASALGSNLRPVVIAPEFWSPGRKRMIKLPGEVII